MGNMAPSKSSLQRLPMDLQAQWEADRVTAECALQQGEHVPDEAVTVAISLDGVMAPMRDGSAKEKRKQAADNGQLTRGPAGYREVGLAINRSRGDHGFTHSAEALPENVAPWMNPPANRKVATRTELQALADVHHPA